MKYSVLKHLIMLLLFAGLLCGTASAAVCSERIDSDGDMCRECALGNFAADAIRAYTGADIALFASGDLGITLPAGEITPERIAESFPKDRGIVIAEMTADEIRFLLEASLSHIVLTNEETINAEASAYEGYFCISGFEYTCDASAPISQRVYVLPLKDETLTLAISSEYADGDTVCTIREAISAYCSRQEIVAPPADNDRILVIGAGENRIIGDLIPPYFVLVLTVVVFMFSGARYRRRLNTER